MLQSDKLREECGLFGIYGTPADRTAQLLYTGLFAQQHRGQESSGICVNENREVRFVKDLGQIREVFSDSVLRQLVGTMGVGHVRAGKGCAVSNVNAQPLVTHFRRGPLAIAHNGCLANAQALRNLLEDESVLFQTDTDAEIILHMITREFHKAAREISIQEAILGAMQHLRGSYSVVLMSGSRLMAFRDPAGMRPLCVGRLGEAYVVASESCALDCVGAQVARDVEPGELIIIDAQGLHSERRHCGAASHLCVFEFIYSARSDSVIDGQSVYQARKEAGRILARSYPVAADLVVGVPDSGVDAARGYAEESGIPLGHGLVINRYVGRTFIIPGQENREAAVRVKFNAIQSEVAGKRVVLVDDSIVRGTTVANPLNLLKEAGATEVHIRISSPPFLWPCYFGVDVPSREHLVACHYTPEQICQRLGADSLGYMPLDKVKQIAPDAKCGFCDACFSGQYPVPLE